MHGAKLKKPTMEEEEPAGRQLSTTIDHPTPTTEKPNNPQEPKPTPASESYMARK
jgi:hypothetical protein